MVTRHQDSPKWLKQWLQETDQLISVHKKHETKFECHARWLSTVTFQLKYNNFDFCRTWRFGVRYMISILCVAQCINSDIKIGFPSQKTHQCIHILRPSMFFHWDFWRFRWFLDQLGLFWVSWQHKMSQDYEILEFLQDHWFLHPKNIHKFEIKRIM